MLLNIITLTNGIVVLVDIIIIIIIILNIIIVQSASLASIVQCSRMFTFQWNTAQELKNWISINIEDLKIHWKNYLIITKFKENILIFFECVERSCEW